MAKTPKTEKPAPARDAESQATADVKYPRRTERRRRTRLSIQKVAAKQFSKAGFAATTMQSIADEADIHVTTLFMHFSSKNELATSLVISAIDELRERALAARQTMPFFYFFKNEALSFSDNRKNTSQPAASLWSVLRNDRELAFAWSEYEQGQRDIYTDYIAAEYGLDRDQGFLAELVASLLVASIILAHKAWAEAPERRKLEDEISKAINISQEAARHMLKAANPKA